MNKPTPFSNEITYRSFRASSDGRLALERALHRIVNEEVFEKTWERADDAQREQLVADYNSRDLEGMRRTMRLINVLKIEEMKLRDLRSIARGLNIPYYNRRTKEWLIARIQRERADASKRQELAEFYRSKEIALEERIRSEQAAFESEHRLSGSIG